MESMNYYHTVMLPDIQKKITELKEEMGVWGKERRIEYLMEQRRVCEFRLIDLESDYQRKKNANTSYAERGVLTKYILQTRKEIEKIKREVKAIVNNVSGKITDETIRLAREYPIEDLIELKRGKALCVFHPDTNPSMSVKNNRYRCWSCGANGDAISLVQHLHNMDFIHAVKFLVGVAN